MKDTARMMLLWAVLLMGLLTGEGSASAQTDTLRLSHYYTTHIRFSSNLSYVDLSNPSVMSVVIPDQNRNVLAIRALKQFSDPASVTAIEESGKITTFHVRWCEGPGELIINVQENVPAQKETGSGEDRNARRPALSVSSRHDVATTSRAKAPTVSSILQMRRRIFHISDSQFGVKVSVENILVYSDVIYFVLRLDNTSGISYQADQPTFMMESARRTGGRSGRKRSVVNDGTIVTAKSMTGGLSAASGQSARMALCFDKLTLARGQVLGIYVYENGGQRNLKVRIAADEVNRAESL